MSLLPNVSQSYTAPLEIRQITIDAWKILSFSRKMGQSAAFKRANAVIFGHALELRRIIHSNLRWNPSIEDPERLKAIAKSMSRIANDLNSTRPSIRQYQIKILAERILVNF